MDTETGQVEVMKLVHVHDVGKAINPLLLRSQINGGSLMGMGFTLMENACPYSRKWTTCRRTWNPTAS